MPGRPFGRSEATEHQGWRNVSGGFAAGPLRPAHERHPLQNTTLRRPSLPLHLTNPPLTGRPPVARRAAHLGALGEEAAPASPPPMPLGLVSSSQLPLLAQKNSQTPGPVSESGPPAATQTPLPIDTMFRELARRASWKDTAMILLPPVLGLGAKITLAIGTRGVMLAQDTHTESGAESAEWFGVMAIGVFALISSIAIGTHDASRINARAPWILGGISLTSAAAFALGEFAVIRSAEEQSTPVFYVGSVLVWAGMVSGAMVNASYLFFGESVRGALPIPYRNTVLMSLGMIAISTMFVFGLNASSQKYGLALRDSVFSITWLLAAVAIMGQFSGDNRKEMGLTAHRQTGTPGLPPPAVQANSPRSARQSASYFTPRPGRPA